MNTTLFEQLHKEGLLSEKSYTKIKSKEDLNLLSIHWEIKTMLYLGVMLLSAGLGILVYKNIDTIGHQAILLFIAIVCVASFFYCIKNKFPFSYQRVPAPNSFFDYILLLACCTFIIFIAYLQFQYDLFGNRFGLAVFFPMALLFFAAYFFDHQGILSMAIVNLATWLGFTVTPMQMLTNNDFNSATIIFTGLALGILLMLLAWVSYKKNIKAHFEFPYANFGTHAVLISSMAGMFHYNNIYLVWFLFLIGMLFYFYRKALRDKSFYFILVITGYFYIGTSYIVLNVLEQIGGNDMPQIYLGLMYFIASGIGLVLFLINTNKKLKTV